MRLRVILKFRQWTFALLWLTSGCQRPASWQVPGTGAVNDDLGRAVPRGPFHRVISLTASTTEIIFALGRGDRITGVDTASDYPPPAKKLPKMGDWGKPSLEKIIAAKPDLIIGASQTVSAATADDIQRKTRAPVFIQKPLTVKDVLRNIQQIGQLVDAQEESEKLINNIDARFTRVAAKVAKHPRRSVFLEIWSQPLMTVGGKTLLNELIEWAGGRNIAADLKQPFPNFSIEALLAGDPDVYIIPSGNAMAIREDVSKRSHYARLKAVRNHRVIALPVDPIFRPGPRIGEGVELLARAIHPEVFDTSKPLL